MPQVQYHSPTESIRLTKRMDTPKNMSQLKYWIRAARKVIPEIPNPEKDSAWYIETQDANTDYIRFDLRSREGIRVYVVILRQVQKGLAA